MARPATAQRTLKNIQMSNALPPPPASRASFAAAPSYMAPTNYMAPRMSLAPTGMPMRGMPASGGINAKALWDKFLEAAGGGVNKGHAGGWTQIGGQWYRRGNPGQGKVLGKDVDAWGRVTVGEGGRGFDLFGLLPQDVYWENIQDAIDNPTNAARIKAADFWSRYANQAAGLPAWLQSNLNDLSRVWGQFSAAEKQMFRDRMLTGAGLPAYLQAFAKSRPQWMTDYINKQLQI
jgi:hypothetical protein